MTKVIVNNVTGREPTTDNLSEHQVGFNTADGVIYFNTGSGIVKQSKDLSDYDNSTTGFQSDTQVNSLIASKIITSTTQGSVPTTDTLPQGKLLVNTKDAILYVNNGTKILKLRFGGNVFKPSGYIQRETFTLLRDDVSVGQWVSVLNLNSSLNVTSLRLSTDFASSSDNPVVEVRVTRDGEVLPVMQVSKSSGLSQNTVRHYVGKSHSGTRLSSDSSTLAADFSQLSSSHGLYCRDSLLVELRVVSGNSVTCGGIVDIDYQEGAYE